MSSDSVEYETQITLRYAIIAIVVTIIAVIIGIVTYHLESERIESATKRAEYDSYHHDGKVQAETSETLSGHDVSVRDVRDVHIITLKGYIDNGTTQTWTMSKSGHAYKVTVERLPHVVPSSID